MSESKSIEENTIEAGTLGTTTEELGDGGTDKKKNKEKRKGIIKGIFIGLGIAVVASAALAIAWACTDGFKIEAGDVTTTDQTEKTDEQKIADGKTVVAGLINNDGQGYAIDIKAVRYNKDSNATTVYCELTREGSSKVSAYKFKDVVAEREDDFYKQIGESYNGTTALVNVEKVDGQEYCEVSELTKIFGDETETKKALSEIEGQLKKMFGAEQNIYQKYAFNMKDDSVTYQLDFFVSNSGETAEEGKIVTFKQTFVKDGNATDFLENIYNRLFLKGSSGVWMGGEVSAKDLLGLIKEANKEASDEEVKGDEVKQEDPNAGLGL